MKVRVLLLAIGAAALLHALPLRAENDTVISKEEERKILLFMKKFQIGLYMDVYSNLDLQNLDDTTQVLPLYANSMRTNDFRLNVAAIILRYRSEKARANLTLQLGDIPMLLTKVQYQFIKYIREANFGFKVTKRTWLDLGYMLNPIGVESSWPVLNYVSAVTVGGYFEPGSFVGMKFSTQFNEKYAMSFYCGNPYSIAYDVDSYVSGGFQIGYRPFRKFNIFYANLAGTQSRDLDKHIKFQLYNNLILLYSPVNWMELQAQYDFVWQTNSHLGPDTSALSYVHSGFLQVSYRPLKWFALTVKGEFYNDPNGFLSGVKNEDGTLTGLKSTAVTGGVEFRPFPILYLRSEVRAVSTNQHLFHNGTYKFQDALIFTAGLKI